MTLIGFYLIMMLAATSAFSGSWSAHAGSFDTVATSRMTQMEIAMAENPSSSNPSYFDDDISFPVDFSSSYVKAIISAGRKLTDPSNVERALIDSLRTEQSDDFRYVVECPVCFGSLHYDTTVTLKCGDVMHDKCFNGNNQCPKCLNNGPHLFVDRETFFTRSLKQLELNGVIPEASQREIRLTAEVRKKRNEEWHLIGSKLRNRFVTTLEIIRSHVTKILGFVLVDVHVQLSPRSMIKTLRGLLKGKQDQRKQSLRTWDLWNLKKLVEQLNEGLPLTREGSTPHKTLDVPDNASSRDEVIQYLRSLFNLFAKDFTAKIDAERAAVPNPHLFYRWMDRISKLRYLVSAATMLPSDQKRADMINTLFSEYISQLPFWTQDGADIAKARFPFAKATSDELTRALRNDE